ncbi:Uncharacterised protein [uncultured archaeon]|nr:Uncharacterised protein [uncultured archaeon]
MKPAKPLRIHKHITAFLLTLLLTISAEAGPTGNQIWTSEPWTDSVQQSSTEISTDLTLPMAFNISGNEPSSIMLDSTQINYSDYAFNPSEAYLWIRENKTWSRSGQIMQGDEVDLIAYTQKTGYADIYLISYAKSTIKHWNYLFSGGYHLLRLTAGEAGRLFIILADSSQPSNALILDASPAAVQPSGPSAEANSAIPGRSKITIASERIKGFDVYLDGVFYSSDGSDGVIDGTASFTVNGSGTHTITVSQRDGRGNVINKSDHTRDFMAGNSYHLSI